MFIKKSNEYLLFIILLDLATKLRHGVRSNYSVKMMLREPHKHILDYKKQGSKFVHCCNHDFVHSLYDQIYKFHEWV